MIQKTAAGKHVITPSREARQRSANSGRLLIFIAVSCDYLGWRTVFFSVLERVHTPIARSPVLRALGIRADFAGSIRSFVIEKSLA